MPLPMVLALAPKMVLGCFWVSGAIPVRGMAWHWMRLPLAWSLLRRLLLSAHLLRLCASLQAGFASPFARCSWAPMDGSCHKGFPRKSQCHRTGTDTTSVHGRSCRWELSFLTYWLSWTTFPSGRTRMVFHLLPAKRSLDLHTVQLGSGPTRMAVQDPEMQTTWRLPLHSGAIRCYQRDRMLSSSAVLGVDIHAAYLWKRGQIHYQNRLTNWHRPLARLWQSMEAGQPLWLLWDRWQICILYTWCHQCHHSHNKTHNLVRHRNPDEASLFPGADVLSLALHAVQFWTRQEGHRMFCTQLRTLLDDVWRGLDDRLHSLRTLEDFYGIGRASCPHWTHQSSRLPSAVSLQCMQLWIGAHQTWCGVRVLPLLLWSWGVSPLRILSGGCSFVIMLVKALVTASAFASGMINTWGLCHFFFWHAFPLIIFLTFWEWATLFGWLSACFVILYWDCHILPRPSPLAGAAFASSGPPALFFSAVRLRFSLSRSLSIRFFMDWWRKPYDVS